MTDLTPNHPAVEAAHTASQAWMDDVACKLPRDEMVYILSAALPHLTVDDLPARLVRDIQIRTIRATARAATYEEGGIPWGHEWHREGVAAWLDGLADSIEGEADHA